MKDDSLYEFDIFLSHSHVDEVWVSELAAKIEKHGLRAFFSPWDIEPGDNFMHVYEAAHEKAKYVGLILSPESLQSEHVALERFLAEHRDPSGTRGVLIPIVIKPCNIPRSLQLRSWVDFRDPANYEKSVDDLVRRLSGRSRSRVPLTPASFPEKGRYISETLFSTLLPVLEMPALVYSAVTLLGAEGNIRDHIQRGKQNPSEVFPWVLSGGRVYAFHNLRLDGGPFAKVVDRGSTERERSLSMWEDPDQRRIYVWLLNKCLGALTGRLGLQLDRRHHRYYFEPMEPGVEREVSYIPLNQSRSQRKVAYQPHYKVDGSPKPFWFHEAVDLAFQHLGGRMWCLSIRPELRITKDGYVPIDSAHVGSKVTKKKSRIYNYNLLGLVNFWRDYLGAGKPHIIQTMGNQRLVIDTELLSGQVSWPGVPDDDKPFANVRRQEDIFTWAELNQPAAAWRDWDDSEEEGDDDYDE